MNHTGYFKYEGKLVNEGIIDAAAGSRALAGIDSAMRFFIIQENPKLEMPDNLSIPVKIEKGSWSAYIPETVQGWIGTGLGVVTLAYLKKGAEKIAENDFSGTNFKGAAKRALECIQNALSIGKHLGHLQFKYPLAVKWDREEHIGLVNDKGNVLYIKIADYKKLEQCPTSILAQLASVVETERTLVIGVNQGNNITEVKLTRQDRHIFYTSKEEDLEVILPDLTHGKKIKIQGFVTRANQRSNTMGFLFDKHILTCEPRSGKIVRFKKHLFLMCTLTGEVTRLDPLGRPTEPRPKLIIDKLTVLKNKTQYVLPLDDFDEE